MIKINFQDITSKIDENLLELAKQSTKDWKFRFDEASNQDISNKEKILLEIGQYVFAGILLACRNGLYNDRKEILDYLVNKKLEEYNNDQLTALVKDYNISFQISDYMIEAINEHRRTRSN